MEHQHRTPLLLAAVLAVVTALTLATSNRSDAATPDQWPTCVGVRVNTPGTFRVFINPRTVLTGDVLQVRAGDTRLTERRAGVWVGTVTTIDPMVGRKVHVVVKSDAALFSERRWSSWLTCKPVTP